MAHAILLLVSINDYRSQLFISSYDILRLKHKPEEEEAVNVTNT